MIRWLIEIWRVISSLLFQYEVESPRDSETGQSPLTSAITLAKDGEGSEERPPSSSSSSFPMLNEHICQLYKPNGPPAMEILFFHGLQLGDSTDAYLSTWTTGDGSQQIWPATWLAEKFPDALIFSVSYDSSMRMTPDEGRSDLFAVAENLMHALCWADIGQGFRRPVILVGHSFGGLVMKQLCVKAEQTHSNDSAGNQKIGKFLSNMGGLFFYGTPHRGISLPRIAAPFLNGPLLVYVKVLNAEGARLESVFDAVCKKYNIWHIASVGESQETSWGPFRFLVVPEASARYGADFCTAAADHISLCKPAKKASNSFQKLINFIPKVHVELQFEDIQLLPKVAVGLDFREKVVRNMLQERTRVGIYGMGGVGKTTVARAVFNELGPTFEYSCFCPDVKMIEAQTVNDLKKKIWEHMHCDGKKIADKEGGWSKLSGKRLLLVLDDVACERDVGVLSHIDGVVAAESLFLITSREKDLLKLNLDDSELYEVPFLNEKDAKLLFLSYAFPNQAGPPLALESHVDALVMKCEGLPLTLEVLSKCLKGQQNDEVWEQTLDALDKAESVLKFNERLWEKLMPSYTRLGEMEQHMFLDATTFFSDRRWTLFDAKAAWSVSYGHEVLRWQTLVDASLVYDVKGGEPIKVHEQLQSLGRRIASNDVGKGDRGRRVWEGKEGWKSLQSTNKSDDQQIHSLRLSFSSEAKHSLQVEQDFFNIPRSSLRKLDKLQYLDFEDEASLWSPTLLPKNVGGAQDNQTLRTDLVLLRSPGLHFGEIIFDIALLPHLAVLDLTRYNEPSLPSSFGQLSKLKILRISNAESLETLPNEIGGLSKLELLQIYRCGRLGTVPETLGHLPKLKYITFSHCENLDTLPESFGGLSTLKRLRFIRCGNLRTIPESFGRLGALNHLQFSECGNLDTLPQSFGKLSALNHLEFSWCGNLHTLPQSFGARLFALKHIEFSYCGHLDTLPECFGRLSALNHLVFKFCANLHTLPQSFGELSSLNHLEFDYVNLLTLPKSFGRLSALNCLEFKSCNNLHALPESFGRLCALNHLKFLVCQNLHALPQSFGQLEHLNFLELSYCSKLERLPDSFSQLINLRHLIFNSVALTMIPDCINSLQSLQILEIGSLPNLREWPLWLPGRHAMWNSPAPFWLGYEQTRSESRGGSTSRVSNPLSG